MVCLYISGSKEGFLYVINCFDCLSWCALRLLLLVCQDWLFAEKNPELGVADLCNRNPMDP